MVAENFRFKWCLTGSAISQAVAKQHYLQVTDEHFNAQNGDAGALQDPVQFGAEVARSDSQSEMPHPASSKESDGMRQYQVLSIPPAGLEPATPCLEGRCSIHLSYGGNSQNR